MNRQAQSNLLVVTIVAAIIIGVGLFMWGLLSGYAAVNRVKAMEEVNAEVLVLRSLITADYVIYPGEEAYIRNIGKEPVIIFRLITLRNGHIVWDSFQEYGVREISRIDVGYVARISFDCPGCSQDDLVVLQVHYLPVQLYDPSNPELINPTSDVILFRVASFKAEKLTVAPGSICEIPSRWNWIWADYVEPVEELGRVSNKLKIKFSRASTEENVLLHVRLYDREGDIAEGEKIVPSVSSGEETIDLAAQSSLEYPVEVNLNIENANWTLIQNQWIFRNDTTATVNKIILVWSPYTFRLTSALVTVKYRDDGEYLVGVKAYDCNGMLIAEGQTIDRGVSLGDYRELEIDYGLDLDRNPLMSDVYRIEAYVIDISPVKTVTHTVTETVRTTSTSTSTIIEVRPETTVMNTWTLHSTQTLTSTSTSYITLSTTVPSTTMTVTLTTTKTRTITLYTATVSLTTTRTAVGTVTVTRTTTRTTTLTIPQSTRTVTRTATIFVPTTVTTRTVTQTMTSYSTISTVTVTSTSTVSTIITYTTTTTTTVKTPVCPSSSYSQASERVLYYFASIGIVGAPILYVFRRRWRNES